MGNQIIEVEGRKYKILDAREAMTVPDCFVSKNTIGGGHGEAKFYLGHKNDRLFEFFDNFDRKCFFLKSDFVKYLKDSESEYKNPQQPYRKKDELPSDWDQYFEEVKELEEETLPFKIKYQKQLEGPRVYINSDDYVYKKLLRKIALPNVTYLSVLKIESEKGEIFYYFKLFLDYFTEYEHPVVIKKEEAKIEESSIEKQEKEQIVKARVGQGKYREKLLGECPFCPITIVTDERLLKASHIKPWAMSDNREKIDPKNGFIFTPTYDHLFDRGFISFNDDKTLMVSPWLSKMTLSKLKLTPGKKYDHLPIKGREKYLAYHRKFIFKA